MQAPVSERVKDPLLIVAFGWLAGMAVLAVTLIGIGVQ
jgi:hypothetical protein